MERGDSKLYSTSPKKLQIPKPTRHAYINFYQDFRQSYKGGPRTAPQMVALAAQAWRGMGERERAPYVALAAEEKLKPRPQPMRRRRVDRLRSQLRLLKLEVGQLKTKAKQLQAQGRRGRALGQRKTSRRERKRTVLKSSGVRPGKKVRKSKVKKVRRVVRRPRQARRQPSWSSMSSSCCSRC